VRLVKGAFAVSTPKPLRQVANGIAEGPPKYRFRIFGATGGSGVCGDRCVPASEGLEEAGYQCCSCGVVE
jgi:hypothetical protein